MSVEAGSRRRAMENIPDFVLGILWDTHNSEKRPEPLPLKPAVFTKPSMTRVAYGSEDYFPPGWDDDYNYPE